MRKNIVNKNDEYSIRECNIHSCYNVSLQKLRHGICENLTDEDGESNKSDTTSSFSLQECMDEFHARRVRRSCSHLRPDISRNSSVFEEGHSDLDLIKQNLSNKEQERRFKPCRDGFYYCFSSDSGDCDIPDYSTNGNNLGIGRSSDNYKFIGNGNKISKAFLPKKRYGEYSSQICHQISSKTRGKTMYIKSSNYIEEATETAPFIHIIQELGGDCVISKVKVNKNNLHAFIKSSKKNKTGCECQTISPVLNSNKNHVPTPKNLSLHSNFNIKNDKTDVYISEKDPIYSYIQEYLGGKLLQKRLSFTKFNFIPNNMKHPPPKPPRSCSPIDNYYLSRSTSSTVMEAEKVLDNFIEMGCSKISQIKNSSKNAVQFLQKKEIPTVKGYKKTGFCSRASTKMKIVSENNNPHVPNMKQNFELKKSAFGNNTLEENATNDTALEFGNNCNDKQINDMLNINKSEHGKLQTFSCHAQPQQLSTRDVLKRENLIGWQYPPKLNIDTVDGIVHHNLASSLMDKNTPVKKKLKSPNQDCNGKLPGKVLNWSPWSRGKSTTNNIKGRKFGIKSIDFVTSSKNRLLHLISPQRKNSDRKHMEASRNIFGRKSDNDESKVEAEQKGEQNFISQSPPGSYHSPIQSCKMRCRNQNSISKEHKTGGSNETESRDFDFSRTVHSPTAKMHRKTQRKLNFTLNKKQAFPTTSKFNIPRAKDKKTYHSYTSDLDLDLSISKVNYILSNIRLKLEAADQQAVGTFKETEYLVDPSVTLDCPDLFQIRNTLKSENYIKYSAKSLISKEPIYSEVDDLSMHISEGPNCDNHTGVEHYIVDDNPDFLYTKVNKCTSNKKEPSLWRQNELLGLERIAAKPPQNHAATKVCSRSSPGESLNNVQEMKNSLSGKSQRKICKSNLSLHRSNFFFEKLYKSELALNRVGEEQLFGKKENTKISMSSQPYYEEKQLFSDLPYEAFDCDKIVTNLDSVSDELPVDETTAFANGDSIGSRGPKRSLDLSMTQLSSASKKHSFVTKDESILAGPIDDNTKCQLHQSFSNVPHSQSYLCTPTRRKIYNPLNLNESIKNVFRKSFRKSKTFVKERRKLISSTLNFQTSNPDIAVENHLNAESKLKLPSVLTFSESANIYEQIAEAVSICRQLPDMETSMEMVEAERLLLFSALRQENYKPLCETIHTTKEKTGIHFFIDEMYLPTLNNMEEKIFFNFFYIITFDCGGVIKSTQSAESENGIAIFRNIGIDFNVWSECDICTPKDLGSYSLKCSIFMLRLRKISANSIERRKKELNENVTDTPSKNLKFTSSTSLSSFGDVVSRFRFQASFTISTEHFTPYIYDQQESNKSGRIFMKATSKFNFPLISQAKSTIFSGYVQIKGRVVIQIPKFMFNGFLNVQDPHKQHYWNRRYCTLDGFFLYVWQDNNCFNNSPLLSIDLRSSKYYKTYPLACSPRELCGRPRSFYLNGKESTERDYEPLFFFSADTQADLENWLKIINIVIDFIVTWL